MVEIKSSVYNWRVGVAMALVTLTVQPLVPDLVRPELYLLMVAATAVVFVRWLVGDKVPDAVFEAERGESDGDS